MLEIIRGTEPIEVSVLTVLLYGSPGVGKTTLGFSAEAPLLLDFDQGMYRSAFRGDGVTVADWADVAAMEASDFSGYKTVVVDTVGRCVDAMSVDIMREDPKLERGNSGQLTLQGWGALKGRFAAWLRTVRSYGLDVVLTAHGVEKSDGDDLILRPDIAGGSYAEIFKLADGVAWMVASKDSRLLGWDPTDRYVGKNPGGLVPATVPNMGESPEYLAGLIRQIKERIGNLSERSAEVRAVVEEYREKVKAAKSATALTKLVEEGSSFTDPAAKAQAKALVVQRSRDLDLKWDTEKGKFAKVKAEPVEAPPEDEEGAAA